MEVVRGGCVFMFILVDIRRHSVSCVRGSVNEHLGIDLSFLMRGVLEPAFHSNGWHLLIDSCRQDTNTLNFLEI